MRISDWSSDVCSSDLRIGGELHHRRLEAVPGRAAGDVHVDLPAGLDPDRRPLRGEDAEDRCGRLDVVREADAEVAAVVPGELLLLPAGLVAEHLHGLLDRKSAV